MHYYLLCFISIYALSKICLVLWINYLMGYVLVFYFSTLFNLRDGKISHPLVHSSHALTSQDWAVTGTPLGLPRGWQECNHLNHHHLLPPNEELSRDLNLSTLIRDVAIPHGVLTAMPNVYPCGLMLYVIYVC